MSHRKHKTIFYSAGERPKSGTMIIESDMSKTSRKLLVGQCINCNRKEAIAVSAEWY